MYQLLFSDKALKSLKTIQKKDAQRILSKIDELAANPNETPNVKKLANHPVAAYRLRVGDYRVLFDKEDEIRIIEIVDIGHRKDIYQ
ncbi:type II toxin-antitoxin system RelE family toxin [Larkinella sp. VNQ87]|uniref:type II toxin-antitoxin system RelE family toxin n=1 Tax=Larkinella sp. VNQ87 TaxID=3400921 RepID=UPI003C121C05